MENAALSAVFAQMADIMEILGQDRFRINSYRKVARTIKELPGDVATLLADGSLAKVPGVGKATLTKTKEFLETGAIKVHQDLLAQIPASLLELFRVPGLGPKGIKLFYDELNITSVAELKAALEEGAIAALPGFGAKKASTLLKGIEFLERSAGRLRLDQALEAAFSVMHFLKERDDVKDVVLAGSLRRVKETIGDVDILVVPAEDSAGAGIIQGFTTADFCSEVLAAGATKGSARVLTPEQPVQVDVRVVPASSLGAALQYFTGSKEHNVRLREIASKAGYTLNEYGLYALDDKTQAVAGATEEGLYQALDLPWIDPRLREDRGEIEAAQAGFLPRLINEQDIRGDLHLHTNASDGQCDIRTMVSHACELGYEYICITDHSKSSAIANGMDSQRLLLQIEEIHKLNESLDGITVLAGCEVDILSDGRLDFEDALLAELDFVIASIHSGLIGPREKITQRTLKAMDNDYVNCVAHPSGRLIGRREPMDIDMDRIIVHAAQTGTALEVSANPYRLDLKDSHCCQAVAAGVKLAISTDSHRPDSLGLMTFGVSTAARGWVTKQDVINALPLSELMEWVKSKRP